MSSLSSSLANTQSFAYLTSSRMHTDHARCQFHLEIEVRKEVEVRKYSAGNGYSSRAFKHHYTVYLQDSPSFDGLLVSALSAALDYAHLSRTVILMLPNSTPDSRPNSFKNSVPVRKMATGPSDGVSEGFGRIRPEIHSLLTTPWSTTFMKKTRFSSNLTTDLASQRYNLSISCPFYQSI